MEQTTGVVKGFSLAMSLAFSCPIPVVRCFLRSCCLAQERFLSAANILPETRLTVGVNVQCS
jgi:hypothetical protein